MLSCCEGCFQGRDWYEATSYSMGLKMCKHSPQYTSNETEWALWEQHDVVRANTPRLYGQFVVSVPEHNRDQPVLLNVLVQDRVGPSLGNFLSALCADDNSWNHATALQVVRHWREAILLHFYVVFYGSGLQITVREAILLHFYVVFYGSGFTDNS